MDIKERIIFYAKSKELAISKFEKLCGLSNGYIKNFKGNLGAAKLEGILNAFPDLNKEWLLTGEGDMLKTPPPISETLPVSEGYEVPLIPILAIGGYLNEFSEGVRLEDCEKIISPIKGVDYAIRIYGDSMEPEYPSGCHVLIKRIDEKAYIEWGKAYVLATCNGTVLKRLMPTDDPDVFSCVSINPEYPPFQIHTEHIFGVYRVLMCMCLK